MRFILCIAFTWLAIGANAQHTKLLDFAGPNGGEPWGSLIYDGTFLYGLTSEGGANEDGTIFKIRTDGTGYVQLLDFDGAATGAHPLGSLFSDGTFLYGMTAGGGITNDGVIFKIMPDGSGFVKIFDFTAATTGGDPYGSLISDGTFLYGMTLSGGTNNMGTIFKIMPDGTGYSKLLDFSGTANGAFPYGDLLLDGTTLYGVTSAGGTANDGTIFRINTNGTGYVRMLSFSGYPTMGQSPMGSLISDGTFLYGMTQGGGSINDGTIFKMRKDGTSFATIMDFDINQNGDSPFGSLVFVGPVLYGLTYRGGFGGTNTYGTLFKIMPDGTGHFRLFDFTTAANGWLPYGSLVSDGTFVYGMTQQGGIAGGGGVIFKYEIPLSPTITSFTPDTGPVGTTVTITGTNFSPTPANNIVTFNGTPSPVTASTPTSITTTVPANATTGKIYVTVSGTTATSVADFTIPSAPVIIPVLEWAKPFVGSMDTFLESVTTDAAGNVYTTGVFRQTTDFDPGPGVFNLTSAGNNDVFVSKMNSQGDLVWAFQLGGTNSDNVRSLASDAAGNIYVTALFTGAIDVDPGPGNTTLPGPTAIYICKYDTDGNLIWVLPFSTNLSGNWSTVVDPVTNDVYFASGFTGTADFDPGTSAFNMTSAGSSDIFILKLSSAGSFLWARRMGSTGGDIANDITLDASGNVLTTGYFNGTVDFDPETGTAPLPSAGGNEIFISKLNSSGNYVWARRVGNAANFDVGNSIATDIGGNVLTTGAFSGTVDFDPGIPINNLTSAGSQDVFVLKLDAAGNFRWAKNMGGNTSDYGLSIATDAAGNAYTTGEYRLTADFDPGPATFNLSSGGTTHTFISKLDVAGNFMWALSTQGASSYAYDPNITLDPSGNIIVAGWLEDGIVDVDPGVCVANLDTGPATAAFTIKLNETAIPSCAPTVTSFTPESGYVGTTVTITGMNFSTIPADNVVDFNGTLAVVTASTSTSITTTVPSGALTGPISVTIGSYTAVSMDDFTVDTPAIVFTSQPTSGSVCANGMITFTAAATGDINLVYQWQVDNAGFANLSNDAIYSGVNTSTLTLSSALPSMNGSLYRVLVHGDNTTDAPSSTATLTVQAVAAAPGVSGATSGCAPVAPVTLTASGASDGAYRWYTVSSGGTAISGEVNSTFITPSVSTTTIYYAAIYNGTCESVRAPVIITVNPTPPAPGTTGGAQCASGAVILTATGATDGNYRWYTGSSGGTPLPGEINSIFTSPTLTTTTSYYVSMVDGACEGLRTEAVATINTPPSPPMANAIPVCSGSSVVINATGGVDGQYRWYTTATGGVSVAGEVNGNFITPALTVTTPYYVSIHNGNCESDRTEVVASIVLIPAAPSVVNPAAVCVSATVTLTASGGTNGNYRWYDGATLLAGEINSTLVVSSLPATKSFEVSIVDGICESVKASITAAAIVCTPPAVEPNTSSPYAEGLVVIDLRPLISDLEDNLDESSLQIDALASGAPFTLNGFLLTIDYTGMENPGTEVVTISVCDLTTRCTTQAIAVEMSAGLTIYNALSPNNDGLNEVFFIENIDNLPETQENRVIILNRWGDVVFEVTNYDNETRAFRGSGNNGNELPTGTYFYKVEFASGAKALTGFISLQR